MLRSLLILSLTVSHLCADSPWVDLFAGDNFDQWVGEYNKKKKSNNPVGERWSVKDGLIHLDHSPTGKNKSAGFIVTKKKYWNFELKFEFLISHNGNSGVKYRTDETGIGIEYQIIDDVHYRDNKNPSHRTAGMYQIMAPDDNKKQVGVAGKDWNTGRIVANGNTLEHWINGQQVLSIQYKSKDWQARFAKSKYARRYPNFASQPGSILLQDHQNTVSYRQVMIRELDPPSVKPATKPESAKAETTSVEPPAAFMNCVACHQLNQVQVGPSLVEIKSLYPAEKLDYFVDWCITPGKKRPEMPQMPSMAHIPKEQLVEIHQYILETTKDIKPKKNSKKQDQYATTKRPRIVRTFVPDASPAAIVICLDTPGKHNLVWDTTHCQLRYISRGEIDNWPYLRSNGNALAEIGETVHTVELAPESETTYNGYRVAANGLPTFLYIKSGIAVSESLSHTDDNLTITTTGAPPITIALK